MTIQMYQILTILIISIKGNLECDQRNTSCKDIKTDADGFMFPHKCPEGSEIFVIDSEETVIGHAKAGRQSLEMSKVISIDNGSVITKECRDLQVECIIAYGKDNVEDLCLKYVITEEEKKNPDPTGLPTWVPIIIVLFVVIVLLGIFCFKKRKEFTVSTVCQFSFLRDLWTSSCCRGTSQTKTGETRMSEISSSTSGNGENCTEEDNALRSVLVQSIDPKADGKTSQSLSLDRNLCNKGIQPPENEDTSTPDANSASNHRAMHRNLRDDPGRVNDNPVHIVRIMDRSNGWTFGDGGPEDHEGQLLLSNQEAAIQDFDKTGRAALVNKCGFDPGQISWCTTASDTDVESTPNMN